MSTDLPTDINVYEAVAARRLQWDNLLWQVPVLSLTAQAFLFTVELNPDTSRSGRMIAALLSMIAAGASMILMAGHRHAELTDAHWLADYETWHFGSNLVVHGEAYKQRRDSTPMLTAPYTRSMRFFAVFARPRTFNYWMGALLSFGIAGLAVFLIAAFDCGLLN